MADDKERKVYAYINLNMVERHKDANGVWQPPMSKIPPEKGAIMLRDEPIKRKDGSIVYVDDTDKNGNKITNSDGSTIQHPGKQYIVKLPYDISSEVQLRDGTFAKADIGRATLFLNELDLQTTRPLYGHGEVDPERKTIRLNPDYLLNIDLMRPAKDASGNEVTKARISPVDLKRAIENRTKFREERHGDSRVKFEIEVLPKAEKKDPNKADQKPARLAKFYQGYVAWEKPWTRKDGTPVMLDDADEFGHKITNPDGSTPQHPGMRYGIVLPRDVHAPVTLGQGGPTVEVDLGRATIVVTESEFDTFQPGPEYRVNHDMKEFKLNPKYPVSVALPEPFHDGNGNEIKWANVMPADLKKGIENRDAVREAWRAEHGGAHEQDSEAEEYSDQDIPFPGADDMER